jgi:hypothetical protein
MLRDKLFILHCWSSAIPDKVAKIVAWKLPRRVVSWAYIRVMAHASSGPYGNECVDDINYKNAYERWNGQDFSDDRA